MASRETGKGDRWRIDEGREPERVLRAGAIFAATFLAGLLIVELSERRHGGRSRNQRRGVRGVASRIRNRAIPARLDPGQTAGFEQTEFVNPTVRIASGRKAQPTDEQGSESGSNEDESGTDGTDTRADGEE